MFTQEFIQELADAVANKVMAQISQTSVVGKRLFTIDEAAEYLGRTRRAVEHMIAKGTIQVTKLDGRCQLDRTALDKAITDCTYYEV